MACVLIAACQSTPRVDESAPARAPTVTQQISMEAGLSSALAPVPERAAQQYAEAVKLLETGERAAAELQFKTLAITYPEFAGPEVNLGLIFLQGSRLPEAESAFKAALTRNPGSLTAGNGLGIVQRKLGKFSDAEATYQRTIEVDPNYAPAHLNLGMLYDLYLAEPHKALEQFEHYLQISGENKQVAGWVVELRKRVGATAVAVKKEPV